MARKKIREYNGKILLKTHLKGIWDKFRPLQVTAETNWTELKAANPWVVDTKLVVKPDMLFGQRGKHDLVALNVSIADMTILSRGTALI